MGETFVIQIISQQNATWQGTVAWTRGGRTIPFRSALELLRLLNSTLETAPSAPDSPLKADAPSNA